MERIASLIQELAELSRSNASTARMLELANQLQVLLQQQHLSSASVNQDSRISVLLPEAPAMNVLSEVSDPVSKQDLVDTSELAEPIVPVEEEKVFELLKVDDSELEAELEEIRQKAEFSKKLQATQAKMKPGILFDFDDQEQDIHSIPTLVHQKKPASAKINLQKSGSSDQTEPPPSVNDQLKEETREVVQFLSDTPIKDLRKGIGINDRFQFIQELFRGDEDMYERSIKTINNFSAYGEAQYWIERELKVKIGWDLNRPIVKEFYALVKRRFS